MASIKLFKKNKHLRAKVAAKNAPCAFCNREVDEETIYGKLYSIGNIHCHYFCVLLSCCLIQKGRDEDGLFGFLYPDILAEIERSKKHRCSYCYRDGATLGCSIIQCKKQFHLPCGRERNAVSLFYGNYKTFCQQHVPKQKIPENIMAKAKIRIAQQRKASQIKSLKKSLNNYKIKDTNEVETAETVCVICYELVEGFPTPQTFWPPCCGRDAWFHRTCLQRMALSAGVHYLKCPLCNDKENFYEAILEQGYYIPDRDAAWELEQNAFSEIYERSFSCNLETCICPKGRDFDADVGQWDILVCVLCGSCGAHTECIAQADFKSEVVSREKRKSEDTTLAIVGPQTDVISQAEAISQEVEGSQNEAISQENVISQSEAISQEVAVSQAEAILHENVISQVEAISQAKTGTEAEAESGPYVCIACAPTAKASPELVAALYALALQEPSPTAVEDDRRPVMPSRMSLRRTKPRPRTHTAPSSTTDAIAIKTDITKETTNTESSRLELNLKTPKKRNIVESQILRNMENKLLSPLKLLEQGLYEGITRMNVENINLDFSDRVIECMKEKLKKPKPLVVKKEIVNTLLEDLFETISKEKLKKKAPVREWQSPRKADINREDNTEDVASHQEIHVVDKYVFENSQLLNANVETQIDKENEVILDAPRTLKTVNIQNDSTMEIFKNEEKINIDVVQIDSKSDAKIDNLNLKSPVKPKRCAFKFSPGDKEILQNSNLDLDMESFKNHYLHEVDKDFNCQFNHKHTDEIKKYGKLRTAIDFAHEAYKEVRKRERNEINVEKGQCELEDSNTEIIHEKIKEKLIKELTKINTSAKRKSEIESEAEVIKDLDQVKYEDKSASEINKEMKCKNIKKKLIKELNKIDTGAKRKSEIETEAEVIKKIENDKAASEIKKEMKTRNIKKKLIKELTIIETVAKRKSETEREAEVIKNIEKGQRKDKSSSEINNEMKSKNIKRKLIKEITKKDTGAKKRKIEIEREGEVIKKRKYSDEKLAKRKERLDKKMKKDRSNLSIRNKNIQVKIQWKKKELKLRITESKKKMKRRKKLINPKVLKQCILQYDVKQMTSNIVKPESDVTPVKKKMIRKKKSPDNLKQMSIESFLKPKP